MNPYFNYVIAQERAAELMRSAKQGRLARDVQMVEPNHARPGLSARLVARLRARWTRGRSASKPRTAATTNGWHWSALRTSSTPPTSGEQGRHAILGLGADHQELVELPVDRLTLYADRRIEVEIRFDSSSGP
jgi:hypothetical protein